MPEWGRTKDGNQEEKEKEVTGGGIGKDQDVNRENYNTLLNISQSKEEPKERNQEKKEGRREVWTPCHPDFCIYFEPYMFAKRQRVRVSSRFGLNSVIDVIIFRFLFWCGIWSEY